MAPAKLAVLVLGSLGVIGGWAASAHAQTCSDTSPCPKGFKCEVTAVTGCATPAVPPCPEGETCAPAPAAPECKTEEYRSCVPGPCMADGDCASGMVCYEQMVGGACTAPAVPPCPPGGVCNPAPAPTCTPPTIQRQCVPRYLLPCEQASDCGPGFTCEPHQECGCSGGTPTPAGGWDPGEPLPPAADAGAPREEPSLPEPSCTCRPTEEKYCRPSEIECSSDAQCPSMWTCKTYAARGGSACRAFPDGGAECAADPIEPVELKRCVPPYDGANVAVTSRGETNASGAPGAAPSPTLDTAAPTGGELPPTAQAPSGDEEAAGLSAPAHAEACSVTNPGTRTGASLPLGLLTLAAAWILTRRRR